MTTQSAIQAGTGTAGQGADVHVDQKREPESGGGAARLRGPVQRLVFSLFRGAALLNGVALAAIIAFVLYHGAPAISWTFLSQAPRNSMTQGGILPCIIGTVILSYGSILVAFPLGVASAIYLNEYARPGLFVRLIRLGVSNLAGIPSVVFGLFGLSLFVTWFGFGVSILSGILTLGVLVLPLIIGAAEEALRSVPQTYREASLGLGATKWQTIYRVVLPAAMPGMLTGAILSIGRAAGETAAIMFTAAHFFSPRLPKSLLDPVMALPYHVYVLATAGTEIEKTRPLQYGTSLVLIALVLGMNLAAIWLRARLQRKH
jgi:phosphate transport system permease protein